MTTRQDRGLSPLRDCHWTCRGVPERAFSRPFGVIRGAQLSITAGSLASHDQVDPADPWRGFHGQDWRDEIDTRAFLQDNHQPYQGDATFLAGGTARSGRLGQGHRAVPPGT
ncbi:MAG TPA: hypothetical protein VIQ30_16285 [Pseudonocardia sp.]